MELVVDASVLFAAIVGKGKTSELFFVDAGKTDVFSSKARKLI